MAIRTSNECMAYKSHLICRSSHVKRCSIVVANIVCICTAFSTAHRKLTRKIVFMHAIVRWWIIVFHASECVSGGQFGWLTFAAKFVRVHVFAWIKFRSFVYVGTTWISVRLLSAPFTVCECERENGKQAATVHYRNTRKQVTELVM